MTVIDESDTPAEIDRLLTRHPEFGDGAAIERRNLARLRVGLTALGACRPDLAPAAAAMAAADNAILRPLLRDPVVRNAFEAALQEDGCRAVLGPGPDLTRFLPTDDPAPADDPHPAGTGPSQRHAGPVQHAWPGLGPAWVWTDIANDSDPFRARLWELLARSFPSPTAVAPIAPTPESLAGLRQGAELLSALMPQVASQVLARIGLVVLASDDSLDGPLYSKAGGDGFPATIFIAPQQLRNPWDAAGTILHEGLHLVLFEIIRCGALVFERTDPEADVVPIPWRVARWSVMRVLFALHVYVHTVLFQAASRNAEPWIRDQYGEPPPGAAVSIPTRGLEGAQRYATPLARASYLGEQLERRFAHLLTPYGRQFTMWLVDALERIAPGVRAAWSAADESASSAPRAATGAMADAGRYRAVEPTGALSLADQRRLVLGTASPPRVHWLNLSSWLIFALCDGRDYATLRAGYTEAVAGAVGPEEAGRQFQSGLRQLVEAGLVQADGAAGR
ncbi:aKG-HExxH-type peptide beta-hydroxylase [Micromonospora deserti]|nr:HEXXH motif-containing putative peptide modification protein [Micromonospora deserti]